MGVWSCLTVDICVRPKTSGNTAQCIWATFPGQRHFPYLLKLLRKRGSILSHRWGPWQRRRRVLPACLPARRGATRRPQCVRACVRLGKVAERCTCVSSVPRVNILSQLHCTSSCVKGAPSVHRRRRMLDIKKKTQRESQWVVVVWVWGVIQVYGVLDLIVAKFCPVKQAGWRTMQRFLLRSLVWFRSYQCSVDRVNTELEGISSCFGCSHLKSTLHTVLGGRRWTSRDRRPVWILADPSCKAPLWVVSFFVVVLSVWLFVCFFTQSEYKMSNQ